MLHCTLARSKRYEVFLLAQNATDYCVNRTSVNAALSLVILAPCSVTRWLDYFFNFRLFTTMKVCHFDEMFAKVGFQFCQILNKTSKDSQKVLNFCQSGEISPNLVTLVPWLVKYFVWEGESPYRNIFVSKRRR